jgi:hypothetical protein
MAPDVNVIDKICKSPVSAEIAIGTKFGADNGNIGSPNLLQIVKSNNNDEYDDDK